MRGSDTRHFIERRNQAIDLAADFSAFAIEHLHTGFLQTLDDLGRMPGFKVMVSQDGQDGDAAIVDEGVRPEGELDTHHGATPPHPATRKTPLTPTPPPRARRPP